MCCFSRTVKLVADTNIFARASRDGRQFLVYSMKFDAAEPLAMILPLPVPKASQEDAVKFLNLEKYPKFFDEMVLGFPPKTPPTRGDRSFPRDRTDNKIPIVQVGSFIASFVPAIKDFARLDEQFRLATEIWDRLPQYKDAGFAVFQLKKGTQKVHPMAFEFPRANAKQLFFPTVHIHDGKVHDRAKFDHALFCQPSGNEDLMKWEESTRPAGMFLKSLDDAHGIVDAKQHCYRKQMRGVLKNQDILV